MTVRLYVGSPLSGCPPSGCGRTSPEVSEEEKGSYASRFYRWFLESSKSFLLLLVALPGLIDTLVQLLGWRSLLWLVITWRRRYLTQSNFLSTTSLAWSLELHLLFCLSQEKRLRWKEIHTHIQTIIRTACPNTATVLQQQPPDMLSKISCSCSPEDCSVIKKTLAHVF